MTDLSVEALPLSRKQIRELARRIRDYLDQSTVYYIDVVRLVEFTLPEKFAGFLLDIQNKADMGKNHGYAQPDVRVMAIREDVYEGACAGRGRDRFTLIHELGHLLLHNSDRMRNRRATGKPKAYCDPEWQANVFAAEFLMPIELMSGLASITDVAVKFGVSRSAATVQLNAYLKEGLIKKGQIKDLPS